MISISFIILACLLASIIGGAIMVLLMTLAGQGHAVSDARQGWMSEGCDRRKPDD